jgi:hypothetical protein
VERGELGLFGGTVLKFDWRDRKAMKTSRTRPFEVPYTEQQLFSLKRDCGMNDMNIPKLHCSVQYSGGLGMKCRPADLRRNRSS